MVAKRRRKGKACENRTKEGPRTRVRTLSEANSPLASPVYTGQAQAQEKKQKEEPTMSLWLLISSLHVF